MYAKIKTYLETLKSKVTMQRLIIGAICVLFLYGIGSLASGYFTARANYQRAIERLEQTQRALDDSRRLNRELNKLIGTIKQLNNDAATELKELRVINSERAKALTELRAINEKQGQELAKASNKITEQEQSLTLASSSLDELKNEIKNNRRTEQRLRRQRDTWAASGVIGFLIGAAGVIR